MSKYNWKKHRRKNTFSYSEEDVIRFGTDSSISTQDIRDFVNRMVNGFLEPQPILMSQRDYDDFLRFADETLREDDE